MEWLPDQAADLICLQETRVSAVDREKAGGFELGGYYSQYVDATAKGYSGVALYSRREPLAASVGIDIDRFDQEGRWLQFDFPGLRVVSLYLPSGSSGEARQSFKFEALNWIREKLLALRRVDSEIIIAGDWNIAHRALDLKNWRGNQKNSGFLPEERAWFDWLLGEAGYVDSLRVLHPEEEVYTWWSQRGQAYAKNVGWRIDYQIVSPGLRDAIKSAQVIRSPKFSDHAPYIVDYDWPC